MRLIISAYSEISDLELERSASQAAAIERQTDIFLQTKGSKSNEDLNLNPSRTLLQIREAQGWMPKPVAKRFLDLSASGRVPEWAIALLEDDVKKIRMASL